MAIVGHHEAEDYNMNYPEPPHFSTSPMDLGISPEPYSAFSRSSNEFPTTLGYEHGAIYTSETPYMYNHSNERSSPMYPDDSDPRGPASDLSIASASSSNMGSPLSSHGQMAPIPEWASNPHGLGVTPGIVDSSEYHLPGNDYTYASGTTVDGYEYNPAFDFPASKTPGGFVGELSQIPRSSCLSPTVVRHVHQRSVSSDSGSTIVGNPRSSAAAEGLAINTRLAQAAVSMVTGAVAASPSTATASGVSCSSSVSAASALVFASPATSTTSSFSSPPLPAPAWGSSSPSLDGSPSSARPRTPHRLLSSPFFTQSSGHFVPPLDNSCWFPLSRQQQPHLSHGRLTNSDRRYADPILIHPDARPLTMSGYEQSYPPPPNSVYPASPALSTSPQLRNGSTSPFLNTGYQPYSPFQPPVDAQRRPSLTSYPSSYSGEQQYSGDESKEKLRCPHPECGKVFKDLKAHMLTHQEERPEKCPITTCEYHTKGFARKYDKNRHTLTHYKGTMVCGFCPGSGSAAEKSFNRADVFKRHLTAVHGVEQTPPNSRKKAGALGNAHKKLTGYAPDATGKCSTCSQTFSNAQDFYEHLDDCVLRIVQQEDPAEAINAKRLAEVEDDREVHNTLEKNNLPTTTMTNSAEDGEGEDEDMEDGEYDDDSSRRGLKGSPTKKKGGNPANGVQKSRGLTHSRGGFQLPTKTRGRKNRRDYPSSWGFDKGQMTMKKRVMAVFDGQRRLAKDDMMLSTEQEVRIKLSDGKAYITDLDLQTMKRAEGFHNATEEEKGPWVSDDPTEEQLKEMLTYTPEMSSAQQTAAAAQ